MIHPKAKTKLCTLPGDACPNCSSACPVSSIRKPVGLMTPEEEREYIRVSAERFVARFRIRALVMWLIVLIPLFELCYFLFK